MSGSNAAVRLDAPPLPPPLRIANRRATPRVTLELEVTLASESQFFAGLSGDISEGGVFVATYKELAIGSHIEVKLALPDGELVTTGTVRWQRATEAGAPPGYGIAFEALVDADRARIEHFCRERAPLYFDMDE